MKAYVLESLYTPYPKWFARGLGRCLFELWSRRSPTCYLVPTYIQFKLVRILLEDGPFGE